MKTLLDSDGVTLTDSEDGLLTLRLDRGQNWINPPMVSALEHAISCVEAAEHPKSLVVLGGPKFFSNGLDVTWMMNNSSETPDMIQTFWRVLARILVLDCRTVAAISGHAYGAGIFLALACDWRVMRTERGFVNFPELNLGMRLSKPFAELSKAKLSPRTLREGVLAGRRYCLKMRKAARSRYWPIYLVPLIVSRWEWAKSRLMRYEMSGNYWLF